MTREIAMSKSEFLRSAVAVVLVAFTCAVSSEAQQVPAKPAAATAPEVVVHVGDLPANAFYELESWKDPASPGGKMVGVTNEVTSSILRQRTIPTRHSTCACRPECRIACGFG